MTGYSTDRYSSLTRNKEYLITWTDDTTSFISVLPREDARDAVELAKEYHEKVHGVVPRLKYIRKIK